MLHKNQSPREPVRERDGLYDLTGLRTGTPVTTRVIISIAAPVLSFLLLSLLPLDQYGESTAKALGFLTGSIMLLILMPVSIVVPATAIAVSGIALGFWDWGAIGSTFGSSSFLTIFGMLIVAMGCEFTPFGRRLAYFVLHRFGSAPSRMVFVLAIVSALLSSFVSNVAVIIMMSSICAELLSTMGEKPGESKLGKILMLVVPMAAIVGGMALINGSPTGNTMTIKFLEDTTNGEFTVTYAQWAIFGVSCLLITIVPMCLVYIKCFHLKDSEIKTLSKDYYSDLLHELGPIGGSEIRWIVIVLGMVACMLSGVKTGVAALFFALISMLPGIGTVPADKALKKLPIHAMLAAGFVPLLAKLFTDTGLGSCMSSWISPLVTNVGPLGLSIISALIMGILVNAFVNANLAVSALVIGVVAPVCVELGYNPVVIMIPTLFIASFFFVMGANNIMLLNKGYGYWEMKDPMLPGILVVILCAVVFPIICYVIGPLFGIPIYL